MRGQRVLYLDQHGYHLYASTVRSLRAQCGGGRVSRLYHDTKSGTVHVGYVVGPRWFRAFKPVELPA